MAAGRKVVVLHVVKARVAPSPSPNAHIEELVDHVRVTLAPIASLVSADMLERMKRDISVLARGYATALALSQPERLDGRKDGA